MLNNSRGFTCPVCGKYIFDDIESCEMCPVCGWEMNIVQFDNHDHSEGANILSVNESIVEYKMLKDDETSDQAKKLYERFRRLRNELQRDFRKGSLELGYVQPTCTELHNKFKEMRLQYVDDLKSLKD